jgi:hypothetical protein
MQSPFSQYQAHRIMRPTRSTWKSRVEGKASGTISANAQPAFLPVTDQRTRHRYEATRCSSAKAIATTRSQPTHFLETTAERIAGIGVKSGQFEDPKPGCYSCMVSASQDPSGLLVTDASILFFWVRFDRTLSLGRNDLRTFFGLRAPTSEVEFKSRELSAKPNEAAVTWLVITANLPSCRNINPGPKQQNADYSAQKLIKIHIGKLERGISWILQPAEPPTCCKLTP